MPNNVHDALFKSTFSQVEHAAGEFKLLLPHALVERIDFASLALCPGSFVDDAFAQSHTDLLFSANLAGRAALLYVLFEHQSTGDPLMPFRLLRYMVRIWDAHLAMVPESKSLPPIIPLMLHHSASGWKAAATFEALFDLDAATFAALADHVPRFRFLLDDLSRETDEAIAARAMSALGRLALWCLKNARTPEQLVQEIGGWVHLVHEVRRAPNGAAALAMIWRYIFVVNKRYEPKELLGMLVEAVGSEGNEELLSVADKLIAQGRKEGVLEGRKEGILEGRRELLLKQLSVRFGALPQAAIARVNAAAPAQLDLWAERVLTAPTLVAVLGDA